MGALQFHSNTQQIFAPVCPKKLWVQTDGDGVLQTDGDGVLQTDGDGVLVYIKEGIQITDKTHTARGHLKSFHQD